MKNFKTFNRLFLVLPFVLFLGQCDNEKNCDKENDIFLTNFLETQELQIITLSCNDFPTAANFNEVCNFGQRNGISNEKYEINAAKGDYVLWQGEFSRPGIGYKINIKEIKCDDPGPYIFGKKDITDRDDGRNDGEINAKVVEGDEGEVMKYKLLFEAVDNEGITSEIFTIDPKIKMVVRHLSAVPNDSLQKGN